MLVSQEWSPEDDREVLLGEGSNTEIAARLGRTKQAVYSRRHFLRNPKHRRSQQRRSRRSSPSDPLRRKKYYDAGRSNMANHRLPWSEEDELAINAEGRPSEHELARQLGRTLRAIHARRNLIKTRKEG